MSLHPSFQELYVYFYGRKSHENKWENQGINFYKCLVRLHRTNYCFYIKKSLSIVFFNKKIKWLKFLFASKGPPYLFEKFSWKFRINFRKVVKISGLINLCKKIQKFVKLLSYKNFFLNVNRKGMYFIWVRLKIEQQNYSNTLN